MVTPNQWKRFNEYRDKVQKEVMESKEWKDVGERIAKLNEASKPVTLKRVGFFGREYTETFSLDWAGRLAVETQMTILLHVYDLLLCKVPPKTVEACLDWLSE